MPKNDCQLRALVAKSDAGVEAQLLELDIAVTSQTIEGVLAELEHALTTAYHVAKELGETPFVRFLGTPDEIQQQWTDSHEEPKECGTLSLEPDIANALAAVLHLLRPTRQIKLVEVERMAA